MKQKKFYCLAAAAVLVLCFASCGSDSGSTKSTLPDLSGTGTASAPFLVSSAADLLKIGKGPDGSWTRNALEAHYELTDDIDMSGVNWKPIGDLDEAQINALFENFDIDDIANINDMVSSVNLNSTFKGNFDGNGKKIKINSTSDLPVLFMAVGSGGIVKNLGLEDGGIVGLIFYGTIENCYVTSGGGIAGGNLLGTIKNCSVTGNVTGDVEDEEVGSIAGFNFGTIESCYATGSVTGNERIGGIVGLNGGTIESCYATGSVTGSGLQVGGIVGANIGTIENCYATGSVSNGNFYHTGGVAGINLGTMKNCYATGNVTSNLEEVGGVVGLNEENGTIENCYATGDVTGEGRVGGVAGDNKEGGTIRNCVALNAVVSATSSNAGRVTGYNESTDPLSLSANYARSTGMALTGGTASSNPNGIHGEDIASWDPVWFVSIGFTDSWWTGKLPTYP